jgi:hypothetical protein
MSGRFIIYALVDPRDGAWRYIGKTEKGAAVRLAEHLKKTRQGVRRHCNNWIRALAAVGLQPTLEVLEEFPCAAPLMEAEREWIAEAKRSGIALTNHTDGGEGASGYKHTSDGLSKMRGRTVSAESIQRMRAAKASMSEETRQRMSVSAKRRGTPSGFEAMRKKSNPAVGARARWAQMNDEERKACISKMQAAFPGHTERRKAEVGEKSREWWASATPERRAARIEKMRLGQIAGHARRKAERESGASC